MSRLRHFCCRRHDGVSSPNTLTQLGAYPQTPSQQVRGGPRCSLKPAPAGALTWRAHRVACVDVVHGAHPAGGQGPQLWAKLLPSPFLGLLAQTRPRDLLLITTLPSGLGIPGASLLSGWRRGNAAGDPGSRRRRQRTWLVALMHKRVYHLNVGLAD